jgi:signal peptidase I
MTPRHSRTRRVERIALALGATVGALCLAAALAASAFDLRPLVFRSGSMSPTIRTGDLAVARKVPASRLAVGDVVSVRTASGSRVTHRIVTVTEHDGHAVLALRGDANNATDPQLYDVESADRVLFSIPKAGYVVAWLAGPLALFLLGGYAVWLFLKVIRPRRPGGSRHGAHAMTAVAVVGVVAVSGPHAGSPLTLAAWTDATTVSGTTLTAYTVPAPATFTCGPVGALSVTFNWVAVTGATGYTLHFGSGGAQTVDTTSTTKTITTAISSGTAWVVASHDYGSITWTSLASTTRTYTVAVVSLCS